MTWTITTTTTISASRAVTLAERIPSEPIKFIVLHPGTGAGGTVTIWDDLGRSVHSTRVDALSPRHEAEFYSDRSVFNVSAAIDGNATLDGAGASVYLVSREAPDPSIADGSTQFASLTELYAQPSSARTVAHVVEADPYSPDRVTPYTYFGDFGASDWRRVGNFNRDHLLVVGDSITNQNVEFFSTPGSAFVAYHGPAGPENWMQWLLGDKRFSALHFRGKGGMNARQLVDGTYAGWNLPAIDASSDALYVQINLGANQTISGESADYILQIADFFRASGRIVAIRSTCPKHPSIGDWDDAFRMILLKTNATLRRGALLRGIGYIPAGEALTDFSDTVHWNGYTSPWDTQDGVHPNMRGAYKIGAVQADYYSAARPDRVNVGGVSHKMDEGNTVNLLPDPHFSSLSGWNVNTTDYTATASLDTAPNGIGGAIVIDIADVKGTAREFNYLFSRDIKTITDPLIASGNCIAAGIWVRVDGVNGIGQPVGLRAVALTLGGNNYIVGANSGGYVPSNQHDVGNENVIDIYLETPPLRYRDGDPVDKSELQIAISCESVCSARITLYSPNVAKNEDRYTVYPLTWSSDAPPNIPAVY